MSYRTAKAKLIDIIEDNAAPRTTSQGLTSFKHVGEAGDARAVRNRGFTLFCEGSERVGPYTSGRVRWLRFMALTINYGRFGSEHERDLVMAEDYDVITSALLADDAWDEATSTITDVADVLEESPTLLPSTIEVDDGLAQMTIRFPMHHTDDDL